MPYCYKLLAKVFATPIHFYPNLIFEGKTGAHKSGAPSGSSLMVSSYPCPQILDLVEMKGSGKPSSLLRYGNNFGCKMFYSNGSSVGLGYFNKYWCVMNN